MIPVLTVAQMRAIDERAIAGDVTIGYSYMLKAGMGLFDTVKKMVPEKTSGAVAILCGKGNNGGDGYVVGRLLLDDGYQVMCYSLSALEELRGEARIAYNEYVARKGNVLVINDAVELDGLSNYKLLIDALLGTGLKGDPHGLWAAAINAINESRVPVLAVDTPSGLNNDTGIPGNPCVKAEITVTMGFPKIGLYFYPGKSYVGELIVKDLNYPDEIVENIQGQVFTPSIDKMADLLPPRHPAGSKFDHGLALLLCGSQGMTGSASMVANAALRTGCGMTHCAIPESALPVMAAKVTETVLHPIRETTDGTPSLAALDQVKTLIKGKQAFCMGPGISHDPQTMSLVQELIQTVPIPTVLDADGINAFKDKAGLLADHAGDLVMTPHAGEWQRLFGELPVSPLDRIRAAAGKAVQYKMTILLKGNPTIVISPEGVGYILPYGNSSLAKAGSGDVLSGVIVSLLAQGISPVHAAILGAFITGETASLLSREMGEYSVIATDIIDSLYRIIKRLAEVKR